MKMKRILYFGCGRDKGHFFWMSEWHSAMNRDALQRATGLDTVTENFLRAFDGTFTPMITAQGAYKLSSVPPFLIVAWHDYTVDTRPGSNSALLAVGYGGSAEEVIQDAPNWFPSVMRRQTVALYPAVAVSVPNNASERPEADDE